jgi:hypothetical protein
MPLVGLALAAPLGRAIGSSADSLAIAVLIGFGLYTLVRSEADETQGFASLLDRAPVAAFVFGLASASTNSRSVPRLACFGSGV